MRRRKSKVVVKVGDALYKYNTDNDDNTKGSWISRRTKAPSSCTTFTRAG
ncbi:hypothetical protein C8P63_1382 [Melghirimyces profundicolus]|uniref:Uncharacterized protein n=1 Tax=Melghirimyces profundicolus TaxID=1242148 RepID=A0A2T6B224_9BACL|nr:hypothetical protein C8P63_1382 [Melghirimyces profundicolus]